MTTARCSGSSRRRPIRAPATFTTTCTPGAFAARFGPTAAALSAVRGQLRSDGLTVGATSANGLVIPFQRSGRDGPERVRHRALAVRAARWRHRARADDVGVAAGRVAGYVTAVLGLNELVRRAPDRRDAAIGRRPPADAISRAARPRSRPRRGPKACSDAQPRRDAIRRADRRRDRQRLRRDRPLRRRRYRCRPADRRLRARAVPALGHPHVRTCYFGAARREQMLGRLHLHAVDGGQPQRPRLRRGEPRRRGYLGDRPRCPDRRLRRPGANANPQHLRRVRRVRGDRRRRSRPGRLDQLGHLRAGAADRAAGPAGVRELPVPAGGRAGPDGVLGRRRQRLDDCNTRATAPPAGQNPVSVEDPASQPYVSGSAARRSTTPAPAARARLERRRDGGGGGGGISESWRMPSWQQLRGAGHRQTRQRHLPRGEPARDARPDTRPASARRTRGGATATTPCRPVPDVSAQGDEYTGAITVYSH